MPFIAVFFFVLYGGCVVRFPLPDAVLLDYLVTTGWNFDIIRFYYLRIQIEKKKQSM